MFCSDSLIVSSMRASKLPFNQASRRCEIRCFMSEARYTVWVWRRMTVGNIRGCSEFESRLRVLCSSLVYICRKRIPTDPVGGR